MSCVINCWFKKNTEYENNSINIFKSDCVFSWTSPYSKDMFLFTTSYSGAATVMKLEIWFWHCTVISKKTLIFVVSSQAPYLRIFSIVSGVCFLS